MSAAEASDGGEQSDDTAAITVAADLAADRHGLDAAIQRYWTAICHLKRRQHREESQ